MQQPIIFQQLKKKPFKLQENDKQPLWLFTDQLSARSIKYLYRLKIPVFVGLNFAISKWM